MTKSLRQQEAEKYLNGFFCYEAPPEGMDYEEMQGQAFAFVSGFLREIKSGGQAMPDRVALGEACAWLLFAGDLEKSMKHAQVVHELTIEVNMADKGISFHALAPKIAVIRDEYEALKSAKRGPRTIRSAEDDTPF